VALSSAAQEFWEEAVAAWVLWKVRCTHPVKILPSFQGQQQKDYCVALFHTSGVGESEMGQKGVNSA
jgi:hypothetical protein